MSRAVQSSLHHFSCKIAVGKFKRENKIKLTKILYVEMKCVFVFLKMPYAEADSSCVDNEG